MEKTTHWNEAVEACLAALNLAIDECAADPTLSVADVLHRARVSIVKVYAN